jgi:hypothetical protein
MLMDFCNAARWWQRACSPVPAEAACTWTCASHEHSLCRGPAYRKLTLGQSVLAADGAVVTPDMCVEAAMPGEVLAVVDCPDAAFLLALEASVDAFHALADDDDHKRVKVMAHMAGAEVVGSERYQAWLRSFDRWQHVVVSGAFDHARHIPSLLASHTLQVRCLRHVQAAHCIVTCACLSHSYPTSKCLTSTREQAWAWLPHACACVYYQRQVCRRSCTCSALRSSLCRKAAAYNLVTCQDGLGRAAKSTLRLRMSHSTLRITLTAIVSCKRAVAALQLWQTWGSWCCARCRCVA